MKKILFAAALLALTLPLRAQEFRAPLSQDRDLQQSIGAPSTEGAFQAAARRGRILQTIVPDPNAERGSGAQFVAYEESDPFLTGQHRPRPLGIRLLVFPIW